MSTAAITLTPQWSLDGTTLLSPTKLASECRRLERSDLLPLFWGKANSFTVTRGRHPSYGWLLLTGQELTRVLQSGHPFHPSHTLVIGDGTRIVRITGLLLTRVYPVLATRSDTQPSQPNATTPYVVELADARFLARLSSASFDANVRDSEGKIDPNSTASWVQYLTQFWTRYLSFLGPLQLVAPSLPSSLPENIRLFGVNAWDHFINLLDYLGHSIGPNWNGNTGFTIYGPSAGLSASEQTLLASGLSTHLLHTECSHGVACLPERITAIHPSRDYQWWKSGDKDLTEADYWKSNPVYHSTFSTAQLLGNVHPHRIIPRTSLALHNPTPLLTGADGSPLNSSECETSARSHALSVLRSIVQLDQHAGYHLSGCWSAFRVGPHWSAVSFIATGDESGHDALRTRLITRPRHVIVDPALFNIASNTTPHPYSPAYELFGPPDLSRPHHPHHRRALGRIPGTASREGSGICDPNASPPKDGGIMPWSAGSVEVLRGVRNAQGKVMWSAAASVTAYNSLPFRLPAGARVHLEYVHHVEGNGRWIIVGIATVPADVQQCCIESVAPGPQRIIQPSLITVRKQSSLRLVKRNQALPQDHNEAIIDIAPGPPFTLFQSRDHNKPPRWAYDPRVSGSLTIGKWLKFQVGDQVMGGIAPPAYGVGNLLRLPADTPYTGGLLAVKAAAGQCVQTEWLHPGLNCTLSFSYAFAGHACQGVPKCVTLSFRNGILTSVLGVSGCTTPNHSGSVTCDHESQDDFDPCNSSMKDYGGSGGFDTYPIAGLGNGTHPLDNLFPPATTTIKDPSWSEGRTGVIIPPELNQPRPTNFGNF
jgi:hypothetical protein